MRMRSVFVSMVAFAALVVAAAPAAASDTVTRAAGILDAGNTVLGLPMIDSEVRRLEAVGTETPSLAWALAQRGRARAMLRLPGIANRDLERAVSLAPRDTSLRVFAARQYRQSATRDSALKHLDAAIALSPGNRNLRYDRATIAVEVGRQFEGIRGFEALIREGPPDTLTAASYNAAAVTWLNLSPAIAHETALRYADAAIRILPNYLDLYLAKAHALRYGGRPAEALAAYDAALALEPRFRKADPGRIETLIALGRIPEAMAAADRLVAVETRAQVAWQVRAEAYRAAGLIDSAIAHCNRALALGDNGAIRRLRGILLADRRPMDAWVDLSAAYEQGHRDTELGLAAVDAALAAGFYIQASNLVSGLMNSDSGNPAVRLRAADFHLQTFRFADALPHAMAAARGLPRDTRTARVLAHTLVSLFLRSPETSGLEVRATEAVDRALGFDSSSSAARLLLVDAVNLAWVLGQSDRAVKLGEHTWRTYGMRRDPDVFFPLLIACVAAERAGNAGKSRTLREEAIRIVTADSRGSEVRFDGKTWQSWLVLALDPAVAPARARACADSAYQAVYKAAPYENNSTGYAGGIYEWIHGIVGWRLATVQAAGWREMLGKTGTMTTVPEYAPRAAARLEFRRRGQGV